MDISILETLIEVPLWLLMAACIIGSVVSILFLSVVLLVPRRKRRRAVPRRAEPSLVTTDEPRPVVVEEPKPELDIRAELGLEPVASTKSYRPAPPIRQTYWYYVSGVAGRFATLREALSASGVKVPADQPLDWKKLTSDTRAKIKRVKVGDKQPVMEEVAVPEATPEVKPEAETLRVARREVTRRGVVEPSPDMIVKPLGGGSYVTIRKKR